MSNVHTLGGAGDGTSTRPYLIRAMHEWCTDNGFTPYVAVWVDSMVEVPREHVKNNEIVLNVSFDATGGLQMGNEWIEFQARFGGIARKLRFPVDHVLAIYARENGQGMAFPPPQSLDAANAQSASSSDGADQDQVNPESTPVKGWSPRLVPATSTDDQGPEEPPPPTNPAGRPSLKRIK